ncbi:MerR family transcriptional regulator [Hymenobacter sp. 15J16-1T3B]|uniref:MerR family transcriptional regulator n=1 Tax=Hymenobacter sp. 15J16-1T3B TaxID=2886941 RepID=UPI001D0F7134|nr:MerR family transcriptional regulator [Hymenobacter sp. 15J16-1T3B]MCC3159612.1 MerR family transcriptional regulator [Hymenobacter sp. 15J16-1T3B]
MPNALSCRQLATLAGVSVRTLHHYDRLGLLRPAGRTEARYRHYGPAELLRLQQILFYKELDFSLADIRRILEDPDYDLGQALRGQRRALQARRDRLTVLLSTIDRTLSHLNGPPAMLTNEELYAGFPKDEAEAYRREVVAKYGAATVEASDRHLRELGRPGFDALIAEQKDLNRLLAAHAQADPRGPVVQALVARHFANIVGFWGPAVPAEQRLPTYRGLAQLYLDDPRYTAGQPAYAALLSEAMRYFVDQQLAA